MKSDAVGNRDSLVDVIARCEPIRFKDWRTYQSACLAAANAWDATARGKDAMIAEMRTAILRRNQFYRGREKNWRFLNG